MYFEAVVWSVGRKLVFPQNRPQELVERVYLSRRDGWKRYCRCGDGLDAVS